MVDFQASSRLAEKKVVQENAQREAKAVSERIDVNGKITVWHLYEQKYKKLWPVDATHLIATNQALLDKPIEEAEAETEASEEIVPLSEMAIPQLLELAEDEELDLGDAKKKADIVEAIKAAREEKAGPDEDQE